MQRRERLPSQIRHSPPFPFSYRVFFPKKHYLLLTTYYLLLTTLPVGYSSQKTTTYYLLLTTYYSLLTTYYFTCRVFFPKEYAEEDDGAPEAFRSGKLLSAALSDAGALKVAIDPELDQREIPLVDVRRLPTLGERAADAAQAAHDESVQLTTYYLPLKTYYLLHTTYYLLLTTHCLVLSA